MTAATPALAHERACLDALHRLAVLDTLPELTFDAITAAAAQACKASIALVSLVDEGRQWFKSDFGRPGVAQTPRDVTFCDHAIRGNGLLEVGDATLDPRFAANPLVTGDPNSRFHAAAPIVLPKGERVQRDMLCSLGRIASACLVERGSLAAATREPGRTHTHLDAMQVWPGRRQEFDPPMLTTAGLPQLRMTMVPEQPEDGRVTAFSSMSGLDPAGAIGRRVTELQPGIESDPAGWMCQSGNLAALSLPDYAHDLLRQIGAASGAAQRQIRLHVDIVPSHTGLDSAVPFGLLLAELVGNALKHGFHGRPGGLVWVALARQPEGALLSVSDDGAGLPEGFRLPGTGSMGLQLDCSLASREAGAVFKALPTRLRCHAPARHRPRRHPDRGRRGRGRAGPEDGAGSPGLPGGRHCRHGRAGAHAGPREARW